MKHLFTFKTLALSLVAFMLWGIAPSLAQEIKVDAQLRSRGEYRNGVKTLQFEDQDGLFGITQRTRLNFHYKSDKLIIGLTIQDVRTWGDTPQAVSTDGFKTSIAQAWAQVLFTENFSLKLGRQPLSYDDQRILGGLDWANQGRFHDVGMFKYARNGFMFDLGFAFNNTTPKFDEVYSTAKNYKNLQFAWVHKNFESAKFKMSFLLMNTGYQFIDTNNGDERTNNFQTGGVHLIKEFGPLKLSGSAYAQFGDDKFGKEVNARLFALKADYKANDALSFTAGYDYVSGTDAEESAKDDGENNSFNNSLATNHKFYGFMDYFYVANHSKGVKDQGYGVGLTDFNIAANYKFTPTFTGKLIYHNFSSAADLFVEQQDGTLKSEDKGLGSEVDLVFVYNYTKDIQFIAGYSQMFATDSMEFLKGGDTDETNNWGWFQINIKPTLFTWKK